MTDEYVYLDLKEKDLGDNGFVKVVDVLPSRIPKDQWDPEVKCDYAIPQAARVSYAKGTTKTSSDKGLIRYLLRNRHTSPFEMIEFKFHIRAPLFVARQWMRHRTASVNEISARYSLVEDRFWKPKVWRTQGRHNLQGSEEDLPPGESQKAQELYDRGCDECYKIYTQMIDMGIAREMARSILPVSMMTEFYWKVNLHNLLHFVTLRSDWHAQEEIRVLSDAILEMVTEYCPATVQAWKDYQRDAISLSKAELEAYNLGDKPPGMTKREYMEFLDKVPKLK